MKIGLQRFHQGTGIFNIIILNRRKNVFRITLHFPTGSERIKNPAYPELGVLDKWLSVGICDIGGIKAFLQTHFILFKTQMILTDAAAAVGILLKQHIQNVLKKNVDITIEL